MACALELLASQEFIRGSYSPQVAISFLSSGQSVAGCGEEFLKTASGSSKVYIMAPTQAEQIAFFLPSRPHDGRGSEML